MNLEAFSDLAGRMWDEIPPAAREGVERVTIVAEPLRHPDFEDVYTLGECVTDSWPDGYGEGDVRSELLLYHGSFEALAARDLSFEWAEELWETILHELLHHREAAAGESGLDEFDWAEEQNRLRWAGRPFDPAFHDAVPADADGVIRLDSELFVVCLLGGSDEEAVFDWREKRYTVRVPKDVVAAFVQVTNLAGGRMTLVVRRRPSWWRRLVGSAAGPPVELRRSALPASTNEGN
ncbi:MAG: metallopeptidase family protein [Gemmatimonadota bacterium]|nr:metallopeptidase family protein [Gemmatimonadota bacterium]